MQAVAQGRVGTGLWYLGHIQSKVRRFTHTISVVLRKGKETQPKESRLEETKEANKTPHQIL